MDSRTFIGNVLSGVGFALGMWLVYLLAVLVSR
jgi:hypothetical protein